MDKLFVAGIVTYNPDIDRLNLNVASIYKQVDRLIIVDNGSNNKEDIKQLCKNFDNVVLLLLSENYGIALAQNKICNYARENGYEWVIILDQDSICPPNIVAEYNKYLDYEDIGILSPRIFDINFGYTEKHFSTNDTDVITDCLASASAIKISAWSKVGGFYEPMFIDKVDFDFCFQIRAKGYKVLRINTVELQHEVGHSVRKKFLFKERSVLNHSPIRYYYMTRNSFLMIKRNGFKIRWISGIIINIYGVLRYETNKKEKIKYILLGLYHGITGKKGKYSK